MNVPLRKIIGLFFLPHLVSSSLINTNTCPIWWLLFFYPNHLKGNEFQRYVFLFWWLNLLFEQFITVSGTLLSLCVLRSNVLLRKSVQFNKKTLSKPIEQKIHYTYYCFFSCLCRFKALKRLFLSEFNMLQETSNCLRFLKNSLDSQIQCCNIVIECLTFHY